MIARPVTAPPRPAGSRGRPGLRAVQAGLPITAAVYGVGALVSAVGLAVLPAVIGCLVIAAALVVTAMLTVRTGLPAAYACACGVAGPAWLAYASLTTAWSWLAIVALALPAAALIWLYPVIVAREDKLAAEADQAARDAAAARVQDKWPDLLARIGHSGVRFAGQQPTRTGYVVHLRLPVSGRVTYSVLAPATERLEVAARLRHGSLRFERGDQAHQVLLHVAERDVLAETVPLPADHETLSINAPIPVGLYEDGQVCSVSLREIATLVVGLRGSGKSNLLNVLLAQLARCPDVLIFAIDLKGGRMAAPWVEPWRADRAQSPVVDWLATDREEAERMLRALLRAVQARSRSGSGGEKIIPSPRQPAVLLVCDEIAVILGLGTGGPRTSLQGVTNATLAGLATQLVMTGRSEAIDLIMATQRASISMTGSADLKSQCALRIGLGVATEAEARLIIPDDVRIAGDLARLRHPGTGIVHQGRHGRVMPAKFYRMEHEAIAPVAERYGHLRPQPDPLLEEALGEDYATRWDRARAAVRGVPGRPAMTASVTAVLPNWPPAALPSGHEAAQPSGHEAAQPSGHEAAPPSAVVAAPPDARHPDRGAMIALLRSAGVKGMTVLGITEQLAAGGRDIAQQTVARWLAEEAAAGRVHAASYGRWKWLADD